MSCVRSPWRYVTIFTFNYSHFRVKVFEDIPRYSFLFFVDNSLKQHILHNDVATHCEIVKKKKTYRLPIGGGLAERPRRAIFNL